MAELYGKPPVELAEGYEAADEYADQGDTRVIRDLMFSYTVAAQDAAGNTILLTTEARRGDEVTTDQIGLKALQQGEANHSFYTSEELDRLSATGSERAALTGSEDISALGPHELAEWLESDAPDTGRARSVNAVLEEVGDDSDLAHRMLEAENIRSDGDPRQGLEAGLTRIIEGR